LRAGGALAAVAMLPGRRTVAAEDVIETNLIAGTGRTAFAGESLPATDVWCYSGRVPGPEIRVRQGARVRIRLDNTLSQDTTVHWHGIRVPNAMDGVPDLTQPPIPPGGSFLYAFAVPDAGTYWYHPHDHSSEQVGRGLAGAFIIEEPDPPPADRDLVWVLGDWRLRQDASIAGGFDNPMEMSMAGRVGNTVTINGRIPAPFAVRSGERIRLRLINAAAGRIFGLEFRGLHPLVIAFDGQPVEPHAPEGGRVVLGPAMRTDLILDMTGKPGGRASIVDSFYKRLSYRLVDIAYGDEPPLRQSALPPPRTLPANTMPEPDVARAQRHRVTLTGGMMGSGGMGMMGGMGGGAMWAINGVAAEGHSMAPMLTLDRGATYVLAIDNQTGWHHPIHLHGHSFRVITRNGRPTRLRAWRDTFLMAPREQAEIAFVADNPGDWMFHCHILAHQDGGMMSVIRIA
jgi:FtsP/CotA-like multicopper oxidase with cupredoxin domain